MEKEASITVKRNRLLIKTEKVLEGSMIILGFVWLILLVIEFTNGFNPGRELAATIICVIFIADFLLKIILASNKTLFLKKTS